MPDESTVHKSSPAAVPDYITPGDLAKKLGVSIKTVRRMIDGGAFPVLGLTGRTTRIPISAVEQFLAERTIPAVTDEKSP